MPLPLPTLDDRTYEQLLDEVRERLPVTAPDWTDYNASDPGITLIELFSYLNEALLYRLDRVPESHYRAFLRSLGCAPRPAQVALAVIVFRAAQSAGLVELPAGLQVASGDGDVVFQTSTSFRVSDARFVTVITETDGRLEDHTAANTALNAPFLAFGADPQPGNALYLGFETAPGTEGSRMHLFAFGEEPASDLSTWRALREEWRRESGRLRDSCPRRPRGAAHFWRHYGAGVAWEYYDGHHWKSLPALKDYTRALTLSGPVRWRAPKPSEHRQGGLAGYDSTYFIRCRLVDGAYDCPPRVRGVRLNAVIARHAADVSEPFMLDTSTGWASQRFRLPRAPVAPGSTRLGVATSASTSDWIEQRDFDRSGPHAKHYVVDHATGDITFGDGRTGRVPDAGAKLSVLWKVGGGERGNVPGASASQPSGTLSVLPADQPNGAVAAWDAVRAALDVEQPLDACGGASAESMESAKARAYETVTGDRCAVTLADLERIALRVPGVPIARAHAIAELHPEVHCIAAAGCVTLVIVPRCPQSRPQPSIAMCRAVARFVSHRRAAALEIHVTGPEYTTVTATAIVAVARNADPAAVIARALDALRAFLHPLNGGPDGNGWPVGRTVYRSEILALLDAVTGVEYVAELALAADMDSSVQRADIPGCPTCHDLTALSASSGSAVPARCGDIPICPHGLVVSGDHRVSAV